MVSGTVVGYILKHFLSIGTKYTVMIENLFNCEIICICFEGTLNSGEK